MIFLFEEQNPITTKLFCFLQKRFPHAAFYLENNCTNTSEEASVESFCPTIFDYFVFGSVKDSFLPSHLHYSRLPLPDFYEVRPDGHMGGVFYNGKRRANITLRRDLPGGYISRVAWLSDSGETYRIDDYKDMITPYRSSFIDDKGLVDSVVYYDSSHRERILIQPQNGTVSLYDNGTLEGYFLSPDAIREFFFSQFPGKAHIHVRKDACISINGGVYSAKRLLPVPDSFPTRVDFSNVLILTNSDQIEHLEILLQNLPNMQFHIGAKTAFSQTLYSLEKQYDNLTLYPVITDQKLDILLNLCSFYLDINHYSDLFQATLLAFEKNLLVLAFDSTIHNTDLVLPQLVYKSDKPQVLVSDLNNFCSNSTRLSLYLEKQQALLSQTFNQLMHDLGE